MASKPLCLRSVENIGTEMSLGLRFYGRASLTDKNFVSLIEQHKLSQEYMQQAEIFATDLRRDDDDDDNDFDDDDGCDDGVDDDYDDDDDDDLRQKLDKVRATPEFQLYNTTFANLSQKDNITFDTRQKLLKKIFNYFEKSVNVMNQLRNITDNIRLKIEAVIKDEVFAADKDYAVGIVILTVVLFISPVIVMLIRNAVKVLQILSIALLTKRRDLKREKKRSERLIYQVMMLMMMRMMMRMMIRMMMMMMMMRMMMMTMIYQMLPESVAQSLKEDNYRSEMFDSATILFSEIDGFNDLARNCTPLELFDMLDIIYKTFDARIDHYDVHKVNKIKVNCAQSH